MNPWWTWLKFGILPGHHGATRAGARVLVLVQRQRWRNPSDGQARPPRLAERLGFDDLGQK